MIPDSAVRNHFISMAELYISAIGRWGKNTHLCDIDGDVRAPAYARDYLMGLSPALAEPIGMRCDRVI